MTRLRAIVSVLLLALWLPASSHTLLEHFELIHQVHADHDAASPGSHEHHTDNHETADGTCALASTHVSVPLPEGVARPVLFGATGLNWVSELPVTPQPSGLAPPGTPPPSLPSGWQFLFRTALSARAPSFAS